MTKILDEPVPVGAPGTFVAPGAAYFVPNRRRRRLTRNQKFLAAAGVFVALTVGVLALATDPSSTTQVTEPVSTSSPAATPPPPPPPPPPQPAYTPVFEDGDDDGKKGNGGRGNGNGNGNKKRD